MLPLRDSARILPKYAGRVTRNMASASPAPPFLGFHLALIQLGHIGPDKAKNLQHARSMIQRTVLGNDHPKPDLIVLPASMPFPSSVTGILTTHSYIGMLQLAIWACSFPRICGNNRI